MSKRNTFGPDFRMSDNDSLMRNHEVMVDLINHRPVNHGFLDALSGGFGPRLEHFASRFAQYQESSDEDYEDYYDGSYIPANRYCGFSHNFLDRGLPKPSRRITPEEAAKNAKELLDEEEKLKRKAEKKKLKKMRQKERRRLEKLDKENTDKEQYKPVQVDPGPEKTADKDKNNIQSSNGSSVHPDPHPGTAPVQSSDEHDDDDDDDDDDEDSTIEPEELDMSSCFVSNAAAIAKRKLEQKPKPDKKVASANFNRQHASAQKDGATKPQKRIDNKKEAEETVDTNDFITKSVELAVVGNQYAASGNLQMAVKYFTDAIKHNPKEYKLFGNRSFCYEKMRLYAKALTDAEIALSMDPKWIKGLYRKGKAQVGLKKYYDARLTYEEIIKLDNTCKDAAEELMKVQIMQLMEFGFTKEQSSNALIIHGTVEKAIESLSVFPVVAHVPMPRESEFIPVQRNPQTQARFPQHRSVAPVPAALNHPLELFPVWVGDLVPSLTDKKLYEIFRSAGHVHSVKVLPSKYCAFVNYFKKEDCERAIEDFHGYPTEGTILVVRYPDRIHTRLGVSRGASTESSGKTGKQPEECYFWRTTGCIKSDRCTYLHIPENKCIDQHKGRSHF